ncbi:MAG TPA: CHRD domain-containing protein [Gemmatimonadaceae bacterium]|nr:CHRD domain-containing protein [Gemmatimonadaceae bacterium]
MSQHVRRLAAFAIASTLVLAVACDDDDEPSGPQIVQTNFTAALTGAAERPNPVTTNASGTTSLILFDDDSLQYTVRVQTIDSVTVSHIHAGDATVAGPIMVFLGTSATPVNISTLATLYSGTITRSSTFSGSFTFDSLLTRLSAGTAYVNVHTRRNAGGEIRGQIVRQ